MTPNAPLVSRRELAVLLVLMAMVGAGAVCRHGESVGWWGPDPPGIVRSGEIKPEPVDINAAGVDELCLVPGIGPKTARAIVDFRAKNGPFKQLGDLEQVRGIGPKKFEKFTPYMKRIESPRERKPEPPASQAATPAGEEE